MPSISTGTMLRSATAPTMPHILRCSLPPAFHGALPAFDRNLFGARQRQLARRRIPRDRGAGAGGGVLADAHRRHQHVAGADERAIADHRALLVGPIVIAGDGAGADIDAGPHVAVAQVGEVVGLRALAQATV